MEENINPQFISLRTHSHYSLLKSLSQIKPLVKRAKEFGMSALALTDYNNMYGAIEFYNECKKQEIKPIIGCEIDYRRDENNNSKKYKLIFLVKNNLGYKILLRLVSEANLKDQKDPYLTKDLIKNILNEYESKIIDGKKDFGLIILSGDIDGEISEYLAKADFEKSQKYFNEYEEIFGKDNFYLEISNHIKNDYGKEIRDNTAKFVKEILKDETRLVATQNSHYLKDEDKPAHKVLFSVHGEEDDINIYNLKFKNEDYSF
jgi:DNA polymerase-3 subunit alpha